MRTGIAELPLHGGKCPAWLFKHMKALSAAIIEVIIEEYGVETVLARLSNPCWFQALGCTVGFDWHSSGLTTTVCGALKEGLSQIGPEAGLFIAGGKGRAARSTPAEINFLVDKYGLAVNSQDMAYASRMSGKVDSAAVQDGYQIYHHCFIFTSTGQWAVIQQGMNGSTGQARRYHWLSEKVNDFTTDPQAAICCDSPSPTLNLVSGDNCPVRRASCELIRVKPESILLELEKIKNHCPKLILPQGHGIPGMNYLNKSLRTAYEQQPENFEQLLNVQGVGAGTLRALCLVAEIAYGVKASFKDPVRYAFAHGGKDGIPFPVNEADIENSYIVLNRALRKARAGQREQLQALRNLARWHSRAVAANNCTPACQISEIGSQANNSGLQATAKFEPPIVQPSLFS